PAPEGELHFGEFKRELHFVELWVRVRSPL
ncbi:MAG: hypothetical protein ACI9XB_003938, partial [Gammaproteobacteria bacterium]